MTERVRKRTKIVATIGPASRDRATLRALVDAGLNVARLNFSHGTHDEHAATIADIRAISREAARTGRRPARLARTQGTDGHLRRGPRFRSFGKRRVVRADDDGRPGNERGGERNVCGPRARRRGRQAHLSRGRRDRAAHRCQDGRTASKPSSRSAVTCGRTQGINYPDGTLNIEPSPTRLRIPRIRSEQRR